MAHIVSFKIEGLAGKKGVFQCELNRDVNIFFGLNGCGKTSLLKILHAAMDNRTDILKDVPFKSAEVQIYSVMYKKVFTYSIKKKKPKRTKNVEHSWQLLPNEVVLVKEEDDTGMQWTCTPKISDPVTFWRHEYLSTTRLHTNNDKYQMNIRNKKEKMTEEWLDYLFAQSLNQLWIRYSTQVNRDVRDAQQQGLTDILRAFMSTERVKKQLRVSNLSPEVAYSKVKSFLSRQNSESILGSKESFKKRYANDEGFQDVVRDIDAVEEKIEKALMTRNKLEDLILKMFSNNKSIQFTDDDIEVLSLEGDNIGLESLSSGEKHLLKIFVQTMLVGESTIMIDEPELSMHIDWQEDLVEALWILNPKAQLIFVTHSPEIMSRIPDDKIFRI